MIKIMLSLLSVISMLLVGCVKDLDSSTVETTYKFSGNNGVIELENGSMVIDRYIKTMDGGQVTFLGDSKLSEFDEYSITIYLENEEKIPLLTQQGRASNKDHEVKDMEMGFVKEWTLEGVDVDKAKLDDQLYVEINGKIGNDEYKSYVLNLDVEKVKEETK